MPELAGGREVSKVTLVVIFEKWKLERVILASRGTQVECVSKELARIHQSVLSTFFPSLLPSLCPPSSAYSYYHARIKSFCPRPLNSFSHSAINYSASTLFFIPYVLPTHTGRTFVLRVISKSLLIK